MTAGQLPVSSAAIMQWHAEFIADTPWQQTLCSSLSEPQIINAFKSDYVSAATAAEAQISFELRPTISWLSSSLFSIRGPCVCSSIFQKQFTAENCFFGRKRKKTKMKNTLSAEDVKNSHFRHRKCKQISVSLYMEHKQESMLLEMVNFLRPFIKCQYFNDGKTDFH